MCLAPPLNIAQAAAAGLLKVPGISSTAESKDTKGDEIIAHFFNVNVLHVSSDLAVAISRFLF